MKKYIFLLTMLPLYLSAAFLRDSTNEVVIDTSTHLMWQDDYAVEKDSTKMNWSDSIDACESLSRAGYSDWRMPNINELSTIINLNANDPAINNTFVYCESNVYWSSTTSTADSTRSWGINFTTGNLQSSYLKTNTNYLRCVRKYK